MKRFTWRSPAGKNGTPHTHRISVTLLPPAALATEHHGLGDATLVCECPAGALAGWRGC